MRWTFLMAALAGTLAAIFYPYDDATTQLNAQPSQLPPRAVAAALLPIDLDPVALAQADPDPFAPRGWQVPSPPAPQKPVVPIAPVEPVAPTGPPPMPYRFVGSMTDGDEQVVYLGRGDQALVAHVGDVLERTYKVKQISATQIELEHMPTGQAQALVFPIPDN